MRTKLDTFNLGYGVCQVKVAYINAFIKINNVFADVGDVIANTLNRPHAAQDVQAVIKGVGVIGHVLHQIS